MRVQCGCKVFIFHMCSFYLYGQSTDANFRGRWFGHRLVWNIMVNRIIDCPAMLRIPLSSRLAVTLGLIYVSLYGKCYYVRRNSLLIGLYTIVTQSEKYKHDT
jgi:hypothetical protein